MLCCDGGGRSELRRRRGGNPSRDALLRLPSGDSSRLSVESCGRVAFSRFFVFFFLPFVGEFGPFLDGLKGREGRAKGRMVGWERDGVSEARRGLRGRVESGQLQEERLGMGRRGPDLALGRFRRLKREGREALGLRGPPPRKDSARPLLLSDNGLEKLCL